MSISYARASRIASSCPKDFDFQFFVYQTEGDYPMWMSPRRIRDGMYALKESIVWNTWLCVITMLCIIMLSLDYRSELKFFHIEVSFLIDLLFNVAFFLDVVGRGMNDYFIVKHEKLSINKMHIVWYILDIFSYSHYGTMIAGVSRRIYLYVGIGCYYVRMHRPIGFLWSLLDYHLIGNIFFSLLKYMYFVITMSVMYCNLFIWTGHMQISDLFYPYAPKWMVSGDSKLFYRSYYFMTLLVVSIGLDDFAKTDIDRLWHMMVMIAGTLMVTGISIAALAIIIGIYLLPEENFRARFRLIVDEMKNTNVPYALCEKVDTFYRMYWNKQKAVSVTRLLPTYPASLSSMICTDMYFEAQQKSRVLRDLSYQFLSEIAKHMQTINYIPGDTIVRRNTPKTAIIYISYGDVEMLTAEDDDTPIFRFTRGSVINPCGASVIVGSTLAHVGMRAATFCTAHVLKVSDLWKVAVKLGKTNGQNFILHSSFEEHFEKVKKHYATRHHPEVKYKSTIHLLKRNLMELKQARDENDKLLLDRADVFLEIAGCYIMRNRKDTTLTEETDGICLRSTFPCILQPMSSLEVVWQIFISMITLAVAVVYPYYFVYMTEIPPGFRFFDYMVSFLYILDIITYLSIGAKIGEGVPVTFTHTSLKQIQSAWFVIDVLSVSPIFEFIGDGHFAGLNKLFKIPKVMGMLKQFEDVWIHQANALRFMSYFLITILLCYLVAAFNQVVMCELHHYCEVTDLDQPPHWSRIKASDDNVELRLVYGLYWSISMITFTSLKTAVLSRFWDLQALMLGLLMFCTNLHIVIESTYSATITVSETLRFQYDACIQTVKDFLLKNNVNPVVRQRFVSYLQLCWFTDKAYSINHEKTSILFDLPPHVHQDIMAMQRSKYLLCIPFMRFINQAELKVISSGARLFYTSPNEILLNTGDISNEIYVIKQGFCEVLSPITKETVSIITTKNYFGDMECLLRIPAFYTVRAVSHVQIFSISRKILMKETATPKMRDAIHFAKKQPEYSQLMKRQEPFLCYEPLPPAPNRELFPLLRKHEPDIAFLHPFNRLGFFSILRYVFPRYTVRPDGKYLQRYEFFRATCAFLSANIFPLYCTLVLQWPALWYIAWLLDISAYLDIIQRMLVGYFNENAILVYHPASTAAYYMKGAFMIDMFACLPLEALDNIRQTIYTVEGGYVLPNTIQILMFNRLLQLYRVPNALGYLINYIKREDIIFIIKTLPLFMATIVVFTSLLMLTSVRRIKLTRGTYTILPGLINETGGWINRTGDNVSYNITESSWNLVLTMIYWVTYEITCTGFNIFQPTKLSQLYYLFFGMLLGQLLTTYFSVRVISIRSNVNQALGSFQHNMQDIKTFMRKENFDEELQQEVILYYEYMWEKTGGTNYRTVLKMCDQITLRTDAILHIYGQTFSKCPILHRCEQSLLRVIGRAVHSTYFKQDMMIVDREEVVSDLYFLDFGTVEVRRNDNETILTKLPRGSLFGNLTNEKTAPSSKRFVANSNIHLLKINSEIFFRIISDFPTVRLLLKKHRPNEECYIIGSVQGKVMTIWKERAVSSPMIVVTREGFLKYLHNHNKAMQVYLILVSMACVFIDIYNAGFLNNHSIIIGALYTLDFLFVLKILINYALPFITEESESRGVLMTSRKSYYKGEFKFDVISVLPLELLCLVSKDPWNYFAYLRLNRVFRAVTIHNCFKKYHQNLSINLTLTTVTMVFTWFSLFVHSATCIWYFLGTIEENNEPKSSWRYNKDGKPWCDNHYVCSLYFILTTFTQNGVADILPRQKSEVMFVIILMTISNMLYMIYVGEFSNILKYQSFRCFGFYGKSLELKEFLKNYRVSKVLVGMAEKYTLHLWRESRGLQEPKFLRAAPQCLRLRIMSAAYMHHVTGHPVFKECEPMFLRHLVGLFTPFYFNDSMYVIREGEITNSMYFIHKGRVEEWDEILEDQTQLFEMNTSFGFFQGLNRDTPFTYSYKTIVNSQVLILHLDDWKYLLDHFPKSKAVIFPDKSDKPDIEVAAARRIQMTGEVHTQTFEESKFPTAHERFGKPEPAAKVEVPKKPDAASLKFQKPDTAKSTSWPLDSRRRSSDIPYDTDGTETTENTGQEETLQIKPSYSRRKSTVLNVDKAKVQAELDKLASGQNISMFQSLKPAELKIESETQKTPLTIKSEPVNSSPWPLDNRRMSQDDMAIIKAEQAEEQPIPKPMVSKRNSVVDDVNSQAVNEELQKMSSQPQIPELLIAPPATSLAPPPDKAPALALFADKPPSLSTAPNKDTSSPTPLEKPLLEKAPVYPDKPTSLDPSSKGPTSVPSPDKTLNLAPPPTKFTSEPKKESATKLSAKPPTMTPVPLAAPPVMTPEAKDDDLDFPFVKPLRAKSVIENPLKEEVTQSKKESQEFHEDKMTKDIQNSLNENKLEDEPTIKEEIELKQLVQDIPQKPIATESPLGAAPPVMKPGSKDDELDFPFVKPLRAKSVIENPLKEEATPSKKESQEFHEDKMTKDIQKSLNENKLEDEPTIKKEIELKQLVQDIPQKPIATESPLGAAPPVMKPGSKDEELEFPFVKPLRAKSVIEHPVKEEATPSKKEAQEFYEDKMNKDIQKSLNDNRLEDEPTIKEEIKLKQLVQDIPQKSTTTESPLGDTIETSPVKIASIEKTKISPERSVKDDDDIIIKNEPVTETKVKQEPPKTSTDETEMLTDKKEMGREDIELKTFTALSSEPLQKTEPVKVAAIDKPDPGIETIVNQEIMTPNTLLDSSAKYKASLSEEVVEKNKNTSEIEDKTTEKDNEEFELKTILSFHDISPQTTTTASKSPLAQESGRPVIVVSNESITETNIKKKKTALTILPSTDTKTGEDDEYFELKTLLSFHDVSRQQTVMDARSYNAVPLYDGTVQSITESNVKPKKSQKDIAISDNDQIEKTKEPSEVLFKLADESTDKTIQNPELKIVEPDVSTEKMTDTEKDLTKSESGSDKSILLLQPGSGTSFKSEKIFMNPDDEDSDTKATETTQQIEYIPVKKETSLEMKKKEEIKKLNKQSFSSISSSSYEDIRTEFGETEGMSLMEKLKSAVSAKTIEEDEIDNLRLAQDDAATSALSRRIKEEKLAAIKKTDSVFAAESRIFGKSQLMKRELPIEPGVVKGAAISAPKKKTTKTAAEKKEFETARHRRRSVRIFRSVSDDEDEKDDKGSKEPEKKTDT